MTETELVLLVIAWAGLWLVFAAWCGHIAARKGLSRAGYFLLGLLLGVLGLAIALIARPAEAYYRS